MEEKKHCKWYNDEFCTNDKSPCVADYCPVVEYPELCKCREFDKDINARSKDDEEIIAKPQEKKSKNKRISIMDKQEKEILFLVFSAGYEAGYNATKDLATAFEEWYVALKKTGE